MATEYGFHFNASICTGCKACMMSCNDRNNLSAGQSLRKVYEFGAGTWTPGADEGSLTKEVVTYYASLTCQQCDMPMCLASCTVGALEKDGETGIVMLDTELCIGCRLCQTACPYHHPTFDAESVLIKKCMLCMDEPGQDGSPNPACAQACPMRALEFGKLENLQNDFGTVNTIGLFGDETKPNVVITPRTDAEQAVAVELLNLYELPGVDSWS